MRRKYEKLKDDQDTSTVPTDDKENDTNVVVVPMLGEILLKLIKVRVVSNVQPMITSSIVFMQRVRNAYVEGMHQFAGHFMQLNNGTDHAYFFRKVTC